MGDPDRTRNCDGARATETRPVLDFGLPRSENALYKNAPKCKAVLDAKQITKIQVRAKAPAPKSK
jgi:hypothetical protein